MKAKVFLFLSLIGLNTYAQKGNFSIKGTLPEDTETYDFVYVRYGTNTGFVNDSTALKNNTFEFFGTINDEDTHAVYISYGDSFTSSMSNPQKTLYVKQGEDIKLHSNSGFLTDIEGSPSTRIYNGLMSEFQAASNPTATIAVTRKMVETYPDSKMAWDLFIRRFNSAAIQIRYADLLPEVFEIFGKFSPRIKESEAAQIYFKELQIRNTLSLGSTFPDFEAMSSEGKKIKLSSLRGKYVLVDFWASWCGPCREQFPALKQTYEKFKNRNFEIVGYSIDHDGTSWKKALETEDLPWINLSNLIGAKDPIITEFGITGVPSSYLLAPDGKIIGVHLTNNKLEVALEKYLK